MLGDVQGNTFEDRKYYCRIQLLEKRYESFTLEKYGRILQEAKSNYYLDSDEKEIKILESTLNSDQKV
jgi:hypothetical protein